MATVQQLHDRLVDVVDVLDDEVRKNAAAIAGKVDASLGLTLEQCCRTQGAMTTDTTSAFQGVQDRQVGSIELTDSGGYAGVYADGWLITNGSYADFIANKRTITYNGKEYTVWGNTVQFNGEHIGGNYGVWCETESPYRIYIGFMEGVETGATFKGYWVKKDALYNVLMSPLVTKVAGIEAGANNYVLPTATTTALGGVKVGAGLQTRNTAIELYTSDGGLPPNAPWVTSTLVYHIRGKQGIISFSTTFTTATAIANAGWQELSSGSLTGARLKPLCDAYSLGFLIKAGNICEAVPLKVTGSDGKLYFFAHANFSVAAHEIFAGTYMWAVN